ncbi:MAG: uracil phosphoribosyltransferase, partial [Syntrophomonadaceae bacterium]|nr:uracil phosphoribosyltransferase [Syntrophomonadaceae bacterium]
MKKVEILNHPIAGNCLRVLRNKDSLTKDFRSALNLLGVLLAVEATKDFQTIKDTV